MGKYEIVKYSRNQIKNAGKIYVAENTSENNKLQALQIINNWRSAHSFPLQIFYVNLKRMMPDGIVAQRLKRLYSITKKLSRFPNMSLTTMQDIGGCRVIVNKFKDIKKVVKKLKTSSVRHKLKEEYDYINNPKSDGYRSYHLVYSYYSNKRKLYNGLFIEIQVRTKLQHMWATAVETVDAFTHNPLKIGQGDKLYREFFLLASQLMEEYEKHNNKKKSLKNFSLLENFKQFEKKHNFLNNLKSIKKAAKYTESNKKKQCYYLLRVVNDDTFVISFKSDELEKATKQYDLLESQKKNDENIVLVSTESYKILKQAYPNYFKDISQFINLMEDFLHI